VHESLFRPCNFLFVMCVCLFVWPAEAKSGELETDTLQAWKQRIQAMQWRSKEWSESGKPFLRVDGHPTRREKLREGKVLVWPAKEDGALTVPSGLLHDWVGTIFIPDATLDQVLAIVRDFDNYKIHYTPSVTDSKLLDRTGDADEFRLRFEKTVLTKTVTIDCTFREEFVHLAPDRVVSSSLSTSVQEVKHAGGARERHLPDGVGGGYLWRLGAESRFEAADGGVYVELEAVGLSRGIPVVMRLLLEPIVRDLSRNALEESLLQTRQAVVERYGEAVFVRRIANR
jgi:hypothetical protein